MALWLRISKCWYFSQNIQKEGQKYLDFFVCPFRSELETSNCLFQNHGFLKIFGFEKKFWRKFQNFWPIFENFACPLRSQIWWSFLRWLLQNTNFPPSSALDPHYKVVELVEICRLRYSKVKSDVGNIFKIINFWSSFWSKVLISGTKCMRFDRSRFLSLFRPRYRVFWVVKIWKSIFSLKEAELRPLHRRIQKRRIFYILPHDYEFPDLDTFLEWTKKRVKKP